MIGAITISGTVIEGLANYSKPLVAGDWATNSYRHKIEANIGFRSARVTLVPGKNIEEADLIELFEFGLARHFESFSNTTIPVWEGLIWQMKLSYPGFELTTSLDDIFNKVWLRYVLSDGAQIQRSTVQNDLVSQERYGLKEAILEGNVIYSSSLADQIATNYLNEVSKQRPGRTTFDAKSQEVSLEIEARGYFNTLDFFHYNQTASAATTTVSDLIEAVLAFGSVGQYIADQKVRSNTDVIGGIYDSDDPAGQFILDLSRLPDSGNNRRIARMELGRRFRYKRAESAPEGGEEPAYIANVFDAGFDIRHPSTGEIYQKEQIQPDNWLRMAGAGGVRGFYPGNEDIWIAYIEAVQYQEPDRLTVQASKKNTELAILSNINQLGSVIS
jgi:hypothetical protein